MMQELEGRALRVNEPMMIVEQTGDGRYYCYKELLPFAAMVTRNVLCHYWEMKERKPENWYYLNNRQFDSGQLCCRLEIMQTDSHKKLCTNGSEFG
ncbi:hypothetical protein L2E82_48226 [Cichorium intybus]|uniref:Uncharacterized protein n=1 Tax=Cichorium intybus TaxID=13427 RepID=A0ACB8YWY0_CICIN|nr:hypothetical protein L2E82_48226 [Cichorium intybus]